MELIAARRMLDGISSRMTKAQMLETVELAKVELKLMDISQVADILGQKKQNLRMRAINRGVGTVVGKVGRVYSAADVEILRRLIEGDTGQQERTVKLKESMILLREKGLNNVEIGKALRCHPSYVTKLLE